MGVAAAVGRGGFRACGVGGGRGGPVGQGAVRAAVLYSSSNCSSRVWTASVRVVGWLGCARSHFFRVCWKRSTLPQVVGWFGREFFWVIPSRRSSTSSLVAAAAAAGEPHGVDHAVVGQRGGGVSVRGCGCGEGGQHDRGGDPRVGADVQGVAGVVIEPGDDLDIGAGAAVGAGEAVVGEVGLPGLVRAGRPRTGCTRTSAVSAASGVTTAARTRIRCSRALTCGRRGQGPSSCPGWLHPLRGMPWSRAVPSVAHETDRP